jgi:hypothetical protein
MSTISIITSTGNPRTDQIFKGVFGTRNAETGRFEIAPILRGIHLFDLLPQEELAKMVGAGEEVSSDRIRDLEIAEEAGPALQATLINAMGARWLDVYEQNAQGLPAGLGRAALIAEKNQVQAALAKMIETLAEPRHDGVLKVTFSNVPGTPVEDDWEEGSDEIEDHVFNTDGLFTHPDKISLSFEAGAEVDVALRSSSTSSNSPLSTHVSGTAMGKCTVFGAAGVHGQVLAALSKLHQDMAVFAPLSIHEASWTDGQKPVEAELDPQPQSAESPVA